MRASLAWMLCSLSLAARVHGATGQLGIAGAYHGTIGKLEVFARLEEAANGALAGRYFYASRGKDIRLDGSRRGAGLALVERVGGRETGRFAGKLDAGAIEGRWSAGSKALPFRLVPVPRTATQPVLVVKKDASRIVKLRSAGTLGGKQCTREVSYPELFGMPDPRVEEALNLKLKPEESDCSGAGEHTVDFTVHLNRNGVLSLSLGGYGYSEGAAHPYSELRSFNVATATGRTLGWNDVFKAGAEQAVSAKLEPLIKAAVAGVPNADSSAEETLREVLAPQVADFFLEDKGVRFNAWGALPHAFQALAADQEFFVPYDALRSSLVTSGEAAQVWTR